LAFGLALAFVLASAAGAAAAGGLLSSSFAFRSRRVSCLFRAALLMQVPISMASFKAALPSLERLAISRQLASMM